MDYSSMILSASGWRKVFAASGNEEDNAPELSLHDTALAAIMAKSFFFYLTRKSAKQSPMILVGTDTRPTGTAIAECIIRVLCVLGANVTYVGSIAAPEIMAYSKERFDGFVYISASHNPIGHNGVKFGLSDGGVISGSEAALLIADFKKNCDEIDESNAIALANQCPQNTYQMIIEKSADRKIEAAKSYRSFTREIVAGTSDDTVQSSVFSAITTGVANHPLTVVCDMNGSARTRSIDASILSECGISLSCINNIPGKIAHAIIPEPENLVHCASEMTRLQKAGHRDALLGYMPDCDGDRGNIVFWNEITQTAEVLKAQEVFALSVMSELSWLCYTGNKAPTAVAVNDPTSMRIEEIATAFNAKVGRAEVGEANVVNAARELREKGYVVRILGEGSNGGNITHPAAVRDPINTLFAIIKLLVVRSTKNQKGLFHLWCEKSNQMAKYSETFTLTDIIATLPGYVTTGVSEKRAILKITTMDHSVLKRSYQKLFIAAWERDISRFAAWGIQSWRAISNNGTKQTDDITDFGISGKGGLKILFYSDPERTIPDSFIWMRGSGTEPVFRVMCDVKGNDLIAQQKERDLLAWHTALIQEADTL